jgi:hypothetical protein
VTAKLTVDRPTAKRLRLGRSRTAGSLRGKHVKPGRAASVTLKLKRKAARAIRHGSKKRRYRARLKVTAKYAGAKAVLRSTRVTLRR